MIYQDFTIAFLPKIGDRYPLSINSPVGSVESYFTLPVDASGEPEPLFWKLGPSLLPAYSGENRSLIFESIDNESEVDLKEIGSSLYTSLFHGEALELFEKSLENLRTREEGLRIRISINPEDPTLASLAQIPWELLYRKESREFLNLSNRTPIVRYLDLPQASTSLPFKAPFRILVVMANPIGQEELDLDHEKQLIQNSWGKRPDVQVDYLERASKDRIQRKLGEAEYHALHFMGHGDFDSKTGKGVLVWEKEDRSPDLISGEALGVLVRDEPSLRFVFLNACKTAEGGKVSKHDPFAGVASALVLAGVPAVIAMHYPITDEAAITFSQKVYELLPACLPIDTIVGEARKAVFQVQEQKGGMEWATPGLFMRSKDGKVFESMYQLPPLDEAQQKTFSRLTYKVKQFWIEGKLDKDIPVKPPIILGKKIVPHAVNTQWQGIVELPDEAEQEVQAGKPVAALFDEMERSLLVLGDAGFGKSITLLSLAEELIRRHEQDPNQGIPVVLFLSTWKPGTQNLQSWISAEIFQRYKIPQELCETWMDEGRLILLLDGLDEVDKAYQTVCIAAVNDHITAQLSQGHPANMVICSRYEEYYQSKEKFNFEGAVKLLPLEEEQIKSYLQQAGDRIRPLFEVLSQDEKLMDEAHSPLMLGMMSIAYALQPEAFKKLLGENTSNSSTRKLVADVYVDRVFTTRLSSRISYPRERVVKSLAYLAWEMKKHHQSVFYIERLQPHWLTNPWERLASMLLFSLGLGILAGLIMFGMWEASDLVDPSHPKAIKTQKYWLLLTPVWIFCTVLYDTWRGRQVASKIGTGVLPEVNITHRIINLSLRILVYALIWMVLWGVLCLIENGKLDSLWLSHPLTGSPALAIIYALRAGIRDKTDDIGTSESLRWSWDRAFKGMIQGLLAGLVVWMGFYLGNRTNIETYPTFASLALHLKLYVPLGLVAGFLFGGLTMGLVESKTRPNEGIILSLKNSLLAALVMGVVVGISFIFILKFRFPDQDHILTASVYVSLMTSLIGFLWFGGFDVIRHFALRVVLTLTGKMPFHLPNFLDYASELILLQKIGGGYIFRNRLLMNYFEDKETKYSAKKSE